MAECNHEAGIFIASLIQEGQEAHTTLRLDCKTCGLATRMGVMWSTKEARDLEEKHQIEFVDEMTAGVKREIELELGQPLSASLLTQLRQAIKDSIPKGKVPIYRPSYEAYYGPQKKE